MPGTRARARATTDPAAVTASGPLPDTVIAVHAVRAGQHGVEFVSESVDGGVVVESDPVDHENEFVVGQQRSLRRVGATGGGRQAPSHGPVSHRC